MHCYAFPDRDTFLASCGNLGWLSEPSEEAPEASLIAYTHDRAVDEIGPVQTLPGTYDEDGVELTAPVYDIRHHINYIGAVVTEWDQYRLYPVNPVRCFAGGSVEPEEVAELEA